MKIQATDDQIRQMAANAVNASAPMGLGFLRYTPKKFEAADFADVDLSRDLYLDYVQGRMTKLSVRRVRDAENQWEMSDTIRSDYQSWADTYKTPADLARSVPGIEVLAK